MIEIPFSNGNTYKLKNTWEELSADEFVSVLNLVKQLVSGSISILNFRLQVFSLLTNVRLRLHHNPEKADAQAENIFRIASLITFPVKIVYQNKKAFNALKPEIREKLSRILPEELEQTPEVRWAAKAEKHLSPDLIIRRNLIPAIGKRRHRHTGYSFEVIDGILVTSFTTAQFVDALTVATEIQQTGNENLLNLLTAILYSGNNYSAMQAGSTSKTLSSLPDDVKKAIFINFNAICEYLFSCTKYAILFNKPESAGNTPRSRHNLGLGSVVHSLIKTGYTDIEQSNLVKFFEVMYAELISSVTSLKKQGKTVAEISELTSLPISKITQIV